MRAIKILQKLLFLVVPDMIELLCLLLSATLPIPLPDQRGRRGSVGAGGWVSACQPCHGLPGCI
ncbi:hypothetical protein A4R35_13430 [Thermogemmatispora tikiterensis]|uniref:Uncharacterized protein n=1 Tax=Thermogemmatispora tikiterensis TaxID=1825093 RepID=A0A328VK46_9CHLR|nr:hypothetical protein A4R35_13430 [Thermogemmatispora tikiterensis]